MQISIPCALIALYISSVQGNRFDLKNYSILRIKYYSMYRKHVQSSVAFSVMKKQIRQEEKNEDFTRTHCLLQKLIIVEIFTCNVQPLNN